MSRERLKRSHEPGNKRKCLIINARKTIYIIFNCFHSLHTTNDNSTTYEELMRGWKAHAHG